jgi:phytoene synthase
MLTSQQQQFELSKSAIQTGSKSFRLASLILDKDMKFGAYLLYRWCRFCDDEIDKASSPEAAGLALAELKAQTTKALAGEAFPESSSFAGLAILQKTYGVRPENFFELLEGFAMDVAGAKIETLADLLRYCYHVAGVVGLMMSSVLKATDPQAPACADSLGRAMQLTNISRDIAEDFRLGRIYLPAEWLRRDQLEPSQLLAPENRAKLFKLVLQLLELADTLYGKGRQGLRYLPFRAAWSISVASYLYQGIGLKIRRRGVRSLEQRTVLNPWEKIIFIYRGSYHFIGDCLVHYFKKTFQRLEKS